MFEPMIKDSDLTRNEAGRWILTDLQGNTFLMQADKVIDWCTNETMPSQVKKAVRGWVDRGITQHETWREEEEEALRGL